MKKIGIISTCVGAEAVYSRHQSESEQIKQRLLAQRGDWQVVLYRAYADGLPEADNDCDGFIISGSPASVNDDHPWIDATLDFIRASLEQRKKLFGICFGHQAVAKALGGTVGLNSTGWGLGVKPTAWLHAAQRRQSGQSGFNLAYIHQEEVTRLPAGAERLASTERCHNALYRIPHRVLCVQGHPEINQTFLLDVVDHLAGNGLPAEVIRSALHSIANRREEGQAFFGLVAEFFEGKGVGCE